MRITKPTYIVPEGREEPYDLEEYQKLYHKQWYEKNKEKYNEQRRKQYAEDEEFMERKKAKAKEYYHRNKKYKQRRDEMTEEQLQARRARHREYYKKNKDKIEAQKKLHDYNIGQYLWDKKWGSKDFNLGRAADLKEVYKKLINNTYKVGGTVHRTNNRVLSFYIEDGETKYYLLCDGQLKERDEAVYKYDLATYKDFFPGEGRELKNQDELINLIKFNAYIKNKKKEEF